MQTQTQTKERGNMILTQSYATNSTKNYGNFWAYMPDNICIITQRTLKKKKKKKKPDLGDKI